MPFEGLEREAYKLANELASIPLSQLACMKLVVNQAYEYMGLNSNQLLGSVLNGLMRNTPDAEAFIDMAQKPGVPAAVATRDALFGDYSQATRDGKPNPNNTYPSPKVK